MGEHETLDRIGFPGLPEPGMKLIGISVEPFAIFYIQESEKHPGYTDIEFINTREIVSMKRPIRTGETAETLLGWMISSEIPSTEAMLWRYEEVVNIPPA